MTQLTHPIIVRTTDHDHAGFFLGAAVAPPVAGRPIGENGAQTSEGQPLGGPSQQAPASPFGGPGMLGILFVVFLGMILMQVFAGRKDRKRRAQMLRELRRHDRVVTIGGIIGAVSEIRDDEVVLKVDEATNTKIRVTRASVQSVLKKGAAEEAATPEPARL